MKVDFSSTYLKYLNESSSEAQNMLLAFLLPGYSGSISFADQSSSTVTVFVSHSVVSCSLQPHGLQPARLLCPWGFFRQEYCSGMPCPPQGDLPNPGTKPGSPTLQAGSLSSEPPGKPCLCCLCLTYYTPIKLAIFFSLGLRFNATSQKGQASLVAQKIKNLPAMRQI